MRVFGSRPFHGSRLGGRNDVGVLMRLAVGERLLPLAPSSRRRGNPKFTNSHLLPYHRRDLCPEQLDRAHHIGVR